MQIKEKMSQKEFEKIHKDLNKVRRTSPKATVDRQALTNLLIDYSTLKAIVDKL